MDFHFSDRHAEFHGQVADFVDREVIPVADHIDSKGEFPWSLFRRVGELGYFGLRYPAAYGGLEGDTLMLVLLGEEVARGSLSLMASVGMQVLMGTYFVYRGGTEEQRQRLIVPALRGEKIGTLALTEPGFGSDLGGIQTRAVRDGDSYVLSGEKTWITSASVADFYTVGAKTDPSAGLKGVDLFLVERDTPGLKVGREIHKLCARASNTAELVFTDCRVPAKNLLGGEGIGFRLLMEEMVEIRTLNGAYSLGLGRAALDAALELAKQKTESGRPLGKSQAIAHMLADMAIELEAARWLVYYSAWLIDQGKPDMKLAAMSKLYATEMAIKLADAAARVAAEAGLVLGGAIRRYLRDARFGLYAAGTSEILRNIIAGQMGL